MAKTKTKKSAYGAAGVDIDAANKAVELMKESIRSTYNAYVLEDIGLFGGLLDVSFLKRYNNPVLVFSTDGVGTKMKIAQAMNKFDTIGQCLVNHCINDILAQGAIPIAFLDYVASDKLKPRIFAEIVKGIAKACKAIGLPIMGGETAEMPGTYGPGEHDLVGSITGVVEKEEIINGKKIEAGDMIIGLPSNGLHTNGYSLARKALFETAGYDVKTKLDVLDCTLGQELLKIHKSYFQSIALLLKQGLDIHGIAHITGGGFFDNIGRLLPSGLGAKIFYEWNIPPIFKLIQEIEKVSTQEMRRVFNLGIGMVLILPFKQVKAARIFLQRYGERQNMVIGQIEEISAKRKGVYFRQE